MNKIEAIDWRTRRALTDVHALEGKLRRAREELDRLNHDREHALSDTQVNPNEPARCTGCGADVSTERLFSEHYVIPDPMVYNVGNCPNKR